MASTAGLALRCGQGPHKNSACQRRGNLLHVAVRSSHALETACRSTMTSLRALSLFAAVGCMVGTVVGQNQPQPLRTWVDQTGRTVRAKLLDVQGPNVVLQLENNTNATVPVTRFSTADQAFVKEWVKAAQKLDR